MVAVIMVMLIAAGATVLAGALAAWRADRAASLARRRLFAFQPSPPNRNQEKGEPMMTANFAGDSPGRQQLSERLADTALAVASRYGVKGPAAAQRRDFAEVLGGVVRRQGSIPGEQARRDALIAEATEAAYQVALGRGFRGSFLDLKLELWKNLCLAFGGCGPA